MFDRTFDQMFDRTFDRRYDGTKAQTAEDLIAHKADREGATADIEEATMLRGKEAAAYAAEKADSETNIAAMAKAQRDQNGCLNCMGTGYLNIHAKTK